MKRCMFLRGTVVVVAGLACSATWAAPVPTGVMSEYLVHCHMWDFKSDVACARLAERLAVRETPTRAERLALHLARWRLDRETDGCQGLASIVADHPDYAYALYFHSFFCLSAIPGPGGVSSEAVRVLMRAVEIEPDNHLVLARLLPLAEGFPPEAPEYGVYDIAPGFLAVWREAMYESGLARAVWWRRAALKHAETVAPLEDDDMLSSAFRGVLYAGRSIHAAALREGDLAAAEAIRARLRRDLGLDKLDYGSVRAARASLGVACHPALTEYLALDEACLSGVESLATGASAEGKPLPGYVLEAVETTNYHLRQAACVESTGAHFGRRFGECLPETTEIPDVRRLRGVLEHHGGPRSSEHHRVLAQGFLGGEYRIDGLREALRLDAGNDRARCELATALAGRGDAEGAAALGGDPECMERGDFAWGDVGSHRDSRLPPAN